MRFETLRPARAPRGVAAGTLALALVGVLTACSLAPPQAAPALALPNQWQGVAPAGWVSTAHYQRWQEGRWWTLFGDRALDALMARVDLGNQNLAQALANVAQAEALLRQAQAQGVPGLGVQLGTQRSGEPARGTATLGLAASWAPDLWGRLADAVRAQGANVQASRASLAGARLSAQGSLAQAYFALREADVEAQLLADIITAYERAETITGNRYRAGIAAHTDLLQAQATLESARASLVALRASRERYEHAIALLVGLAPAALSVPAAPWVRQLPEVPLALPSELLLRRPDVAAAERAVAAANANIGAARAAWFPSLALSAGLGGGAGSLASLVSAPALTWSLGAALAQTLFDGGARSAAVDQALATHQAASAGYRQTALAAMGQVEDQLTAVNALAAQIAHTRAAAEAAAGAEQRTMNSYQAGITAYSAVITAQASALSARRSVLQLELQRQQALVALVQALGGGWQAPWEAMPLLPE